MMHHLTKCSGPIFRLRRRFRSQELSIYDSCMGHDQIFGEINVHCCAWMVLSRVDIEEIGVGPHR